MGLEAVHLEVPGLLMLLVGGPGFKNGYVTRFDPHENAVGRCRGGS